MTSNDEPAKPARITWEHVRRFLAVYVCLLCWLPIMFGGKRLVVGLSVWKAAGPDAMVKYPASRYKGNYIAESSEPVRKAVFEGGAIAAAGAAGFLAIGWKLLRDRRRRRQSGE